MMTAMTSAGTSLALVASIPATLDDAGFEALAPYTVVGEITDIEGDFGRAYTLATHNPLATRATGKFKGSYDEGSVTLTLALDESDGGQSLMDAALTSDDPYAFKLTMQDGEVLYFQAMVMAFPENYGGVDAITSRKATLEITAAPGADPFEIQRIALRDYLATTDGADNPHSLAAMADPPTITTSTSSTLWVNTITLNAAGALDGVLLEGGAPAFYSVATQFLRPEQGSVNAGTAATNRISISSRVSVTVNASAVAFYFVGTGTKARFLVDGQYVDLTGTAPPNNTGTGANWIILTFSGKAVRTVTAELQNNSASPASGTWLRTIGLLTGDTFLSPPSRKSFRGTALGDSVTAATGADYNGDGFVTVANDYLGCEIWPSGSGSTGYTATATGTKYNLKQRAAADLDLMLATGPVDFVIVAMGLNDNNATLLADANEAFDIIRAKVPRALVFVVGRWDAYAPSADPGTGDSSYTAINASIEAAANRPGFYFLDPSGVSYTKFGGTGVHPDNAGHTTLGLWLDSAMRAAVA